MILSNISVPLLGMVDTGVTGHLENAAYLGAVAVGATIFGFLYTGVNFLRMGTTGIAAQQFGANDFDGLRVALGQALIVSLAIAALLILFQGPIGSIAISLIGPDAAVAQFADQYFSIRIWSAPATLANFALIGWFLGLQNARVPLIIVLAINLTNIALDLILVIVVGMKVDGVAIASVIAEFTGLSVGLAFVVRELLRRERKPVCTHDGPGVYFYFHHSPGRAPGRSHTCGERDSHEPSESACVRSGRIRARCGGAGWQGCR
jgi:MATE family multidrug resistance protein